MKATTTTLNNLSQLKPGDKITLVIENTMGIVVTRQAKFAGFEFKNYAQYNNVLALKYTLKGKRKVEGRYFIEGALSVAKGWQDVDTTVKSTLPPHLAKFVTTEVEAFNPANFTQAASQLTNVIYEQA